jgi:putative membrane protein
MKTLIRGIAIYSLVLYVLPLIIPGMHIYGGIFTYLIGGVSLALLFMVIKPILSILSFPLNFITFGLFSLVINAFILYLLTIFVAGISVSAFSYSRSDVFGFIIPKIPFSIFYAYVYSAFLLSLFDSLISWLIS